MIRVAFFAPHGYHDAVLLPVIDALGQRLTWLHSHDRREVVAYDPSILVLVSFRKLEWFRHHLPRAQIGSIRHGLVAKQGFASLPHRAAARRFDFLCVGDTETVDRYRANGAAPTEVWMTGYPQLDPLFRRDQPPATGLPPDQPVILFAPTWNRDLSAAPVFGRDLASLVRGSGRPLNILIKPHPMTPDISPEWMASWRDIAASDPRVRLLEARSDVTAAMLAADLLISDASSVILEFLALDRPVVLVTNPRAGNDPEYNVEDLPWRWRDLGEEVKDPSVLGDTIDRALSEPAKRSPIRRAYAAQLFGDLRDGRNAEPVADRLVDLANRIDAGLAPAPLRGDGAGQRHSGSAARAVARGLRRVLATR